MTDFPPPPPPDETLTDGISEIPPIDVKPDPSASHKLNGDSKISSLFAPSSTKPPRKEKAPTPSMPRPGVIKKRLSELYVGVGVMLSPVDPVCAKATMDSADDCAEAMEQLCRENEAVRRVVLKLIETSTLGKVIVAHLPIMMAVAMHHMPMFQQAAGQQLADDVEEHLKRQGDEAA
jgi:hypothetical protein